MNKINEELSFKDASTQLEKIVKDLESPSITLEKSTELFESGVLLAKACYEKLETSRGKITMLVKELEEFTEKPFDMPNDEE